VDLGGSYQLASWAYLVGIEEELEFLICVPDDLD